MREDQSGGFRLSRPHEDRERHTLVDHRPGGSPTQFPVRTWLAIGIARVKTERTDACVAAYETLVEHAQTSNVHAGPAVVLAADNGRRVVTLVGVRGHDGFGHLTAAWDDHHRNAQHRVIAESVSFALYEVAAEFGDAGIDPASHDTYVFERVERTIAQANALFAAIGDVPEFRGATVFNADGAVATIMLTRFTNLAGYNAFRATRTAIDTLGPVAAPGESSFIIRPRKTFELLPT
jgi:hypothetical protein